MSRQSESLPILVEHRPEPEYSPQERELLLQIAHESILSFLERRDMSIFAPSAHLSEPRGVFTTLYLEGALRGCVGFPFGILPVYKAVAEAARAAALEDPRFRPIRLDETRRLQISISVLSQLQAITANEIQIGHHGLVITHHGQRGLLLPQVPVEHGWDRSTFLEQTCLKAGLPPDSWRNGAQIEAFTAESFSDHAVKGQVF